MSREIFVDSAKLDAIKEYKSVATGVTTNQLIMLKDGVRIDKFDDHIRQICVEINGPVSVELTDSKATVDEMVEEAERLRGIDEAVVVKVPVIPGLTKSLAVIEELKKREIPVNVTAMMTFEQMLLATLATRDFKQAYVSLFWARSDDDHKKYRTNSDWLESNPKVGPESKVNSSPGRIVAATSTFIREGGFEQPKIIVGSIRNARMVGEAFAAGADIVTVTPDVLGAMLESQRTRETVEEFDEAWNELKAKK